MMRMKCAKTKKCAISALKRELSAQEKIITEFIAENGSITSNQTMELLNLKKRRAQVILGQMIKAKTKVYIYTHVSTIMQIDGYSLDAQKFRMKAYTDYNDFEIVGEYEDAAI